MLSSKNSEYSRAIKSLMARRKLRRKDLKIIEQLLSLFGNPERSFPSVHIAGTNGKGSVCCKLAAALQHAGYRVGLFTSPHLIDFEERITINGEQIPKEKVLDSYLKIADPEPNFFECTVAIAFDYFKEKQVDIAIIETGLGGIFDSTNVLKPLLSIITSIGLDHTEFLGDTLDHIATQKAGIIKPQTPVILGPRVHFAPIFARAKEVDAPVIQVEKSSPLYDEENCATVEAALKVLPFKTTRADVEFGLSARLPCRFERRGRFILDVAHNPDGFARLKETLDHTFPNQSLHFIIGMKRGKNIQACLKAIEEKIAHVHFIGEGATVEELENAIANCSADPTVICGSCYIMADVLKQIERR